MGAGLAQMLTDAWCREMPEIRDDSVCHLLTMWAVTRTVWTELYRRAVMINYPVGTLSSEPLCVITDGMTYQEKIEALSGTIYDYDDVNDNQPG